jgi:hypothetical protein
MNEKKDHHLPLNRNEYANDLKDKNNLPFGDNSEFIEGILTGHNLTDRELYEQVDYLSGRKSSYYFGEVVLKEEGPKSKNTFIPLEEKSYYKISLSGTGYNTTKNISKFEGDWRKSPLKDDLYIFPYNIYTYTEINEETGEPETISKNEFRWKRVKQIDEFFYLVWGGTYSYTKEIILLSIPAAMIVIFF